MTKFAVLIALAILPLFASLKSQANSLGLFPGFGTSTALGFMPGASTSTTTRPGSDTGCTVCEVKKSGGSWVMRYKCSFTPKLTTMKFTAQHDVLNYQRAICGSKRIAQEASGDATPKTAAKTKSSWSQSAFTGQ